MVRLLNLAHNVNAQIKQEIKLKRNTINQEKKKKANKKAMHTMEVLTNAAT